MLLPNKTICPECGAKLLRRSRWKSHTEKRNHPGHLPFRCVGCGHRYVAPVKHNRAAFASAAAAVALASFGLAIFISSPTDPMLAEWGSETGLPVPSVALTAQTLEAAEAGDPEAQYRIGRSRLVDAAIEPAKASEALNWLQRAADAGHTEAMVHLGRIYQSGIGALQNYELAASWVERAALAADPEGMLELGRLYRDGVWYDKDAVQAYVWMNRAAAANAPGAAREREAVARMLDTEALKEAQRRSLEPVKPTPAGEPSEAE